MEIYIVVFILVCFFAFISCGLPFSVKKKEKWFLILVGLLLTFFAGLRSDLVGSDTLAYKQWFKYFNNLGWEGSLNATYNDAEDGYKIFNLIIGELSNNAQIVLIVSNAIINLSLLSYFYKHSENIYTSTFLFLGLNHFFTSMNTFRFYLALAIVIWAYDYLAEKKYFKAIVLMIIGFFFHRLIVVYSLSLIFAYVLRGKRQNVIKALIVEMIAAAMIHFAIQIALKIFPKYTLYFSGVIQEGSGRGILNIVFLISDILLILYLMFIEKRDSEEEHMYIILLSVLAFFRIVGGSIPRGFRIVQTLDFSILIIIPYVIQGKANNKFVYNAVLIGLSFALYVYYLLIDAASIVPYSFCFQ